MELDRITLEKSFFNLSGQMTASPRASKLALFFAQAHTLAQYRPPQGERNSNLLTETGGAERQQKLNTDDSDRLLRCSQREEFATFSGKVRAECR